MAGYPSRVMPGTADFDSLVQRVIKQESGGNPNAVSPVGAAGLMQIMPGTARSPGLPGVQPIDPAQRFDPAVNERFGRQYLGALLTRYDGDVNRALAGYNWGFGRADKWDGDPANLPSETRGYLSAIQGNARGGPASAGTAASSTGAIAAVGADIAGRTVGSSDQRMRPSMLASTLFEGPTGWTGGSAAADVSGLLRNAQPPAQRGPRIQSQRPQGGVRAVPIIQPR